MKALVPDWALSGPRYKAISESARTAYLWNGAKIQVMGMDAPERAEGPPLDGIVLDEYGNMIPEVWTQHIRPALSTLGRPPGWAWFIGVPEGRNHYYKLFCDVEKPELEKIWARFTWPTKDINPEEALAAMADMDILTWRQEYEGAFVSFEGRCYYAFNREYNVAPANERVVYNPYLPLILTFDFNHKPGVAGYVQEQESPKWLDRINGGRSFSKVTAAIGEVYIENNSNTEIVCDKIIADWGQRHHGEVLLYGDASGGAHTSQGVKGSDWDIVEAKLRPVFGNNLWAMYSKRNPHIRTRVNSVNSRFHSADGSVKSIFDNKLCSAHIRDFEGVANDENGDPEKVDGSMLTHISDAFGYYINEAHPLGGDVMTKQAA